MAVVLLSRSSRAHQAFQSFPTRRSSDLLRLALHRRRHRRRVHRAGLGVARRARDGPEVRAGDRKSTRLNSSHVEISYAVFCLKKKMTELTAIYVVTERAIPVQTTHGRVT